MKRWINAIETFFNLDTTKQTFNKFNYKENIGYVSLFLEKKLFYFLG